MLASTYLQRISYNIWNNAVRKIFFFMLISIDGFFEGPDHDLSWHNTDDEFQEFAIEQTSNLGAILFGRRTYEMMAYFWPSEEARKTDPIVAGLMNNTPKIVFSRTLAKVGETEYWKNVRLIKDSVEDEIKKLKQDEGKDMAIFGSNNLMVSLAEMGLIDEFRILVNPIAIGKGTPLFTGIKEKFNLKLIKIREFKNGNVLLSYQPVK